jgi:hypothetical protein
MKRFGAIASLLLVAAIGVGAFVYAGSDNGGGKKSSATVVKEESNTTTVTTVKQQAQAPQPVTSNSVASASPTPKPTTDDNAVFNVGDQEKPELDGYEARRVFVGVSPSVTVTGKTVQIEVRGFHAGENVVISILPAPSLTGTPKAAVTIAPLTILTDKRGRGKLKYVVTQAPGRWVVTAQGTTPDTGGVFRSSATILKVVLKK